MKNITVARRYAGALYDEASSQKIVDNVLADIAQFSKLMTESSEFHTFVSSPTISVEEKLKVIEALNKLGLLNKLVVSFLMVLTRGHRLPILPDVIEAFNECIMAARGEVKVLVAYASPVDDNIRNELKERLAKMTGKKVVLDESVDEKLLGGMRVVVGSVLYDASIKGKLDNMKSKLGTGL